MRDTSLKNSWGLLALNPPESRQAWLVRATCCYQEGVYKLAVIVDTHGLFLQGDHNDFRIHPAVVLQELQVGLMHLIVRCLITGVGGHGLKVGQVHV